MSEAGVYTARGIHELNMMVTSLAEQGFRIITVIDTQNGDYHVVAQKDEPRYSSGQDSQGDGRQTADSSA